MDEQLNIQFDADNAIRRNLREGRFSVFIEYNPPTIDQPFRLALKPGAELAALVDEDERITALAITHNYSPEDGHSLIDVVSHLRSHCEKESLVYLSGRGLTRDAYRSLLASLRSLGITSLAAVSGIAAADHPRDKAGRPLCRPGGYMDSCRQLQLIRGDYPELCAGATVNPFKYNISDVYLQYAKMVRKLNCGAEFIVAQAGWDMRKYQELQWYLQSRDLSEPFVARLLLLRPGDVTSIVDRQRGGIVMSRELGALLQREGQVNDVQALAAQIRRISLQAAGCRLLGYSGIQLAGLGDTRTARTVLDKVFEALDEFTDYDVWLKAWQEFHDRVEMAPYPNRYYAFKNLLEEGLVTFAKETARHTAFSIPRPAFADRTRYLIARGLRLQRHHGPVASLFRAAISQQRAGRHWDLERTFQLSAAQCPKGLEYGACGGSRPDGTCEFGHKPCFYHRVLELAQWRNDLESLERADAD